MTRLLVVDVGNTNIVLGVFRDETLLGSWRIATARDRTADEYGILARLLLEEHADDLQGAIVSSVVPPLDGTIESMIESTFSLSPLFVRPGVRTGLSVKTENPLEVGADRIVNAVAAYDRFGGPTIVVDFGTATTFDLVSAKGEYLGGIIAPGVSISSEALFSRAARLPRVELRRPPRLIGTGTVSSMQSGIWFGYLGLVDGILARMIDEIGTVRRVVATGGLADGLGEDSRFIDEIDPNLTMSGLRLIWDRNQKPRKEPAR